MIVIVIRSITTISPCLCVAIKRIVQSHGGHFRYKKIVRRHLCLSHFQGNVCVFRITQTVCMFDRLNIR